MKPISDNKGNKLYGYSLYDLQKMTHLQQQQIKSLNRLIRWKQLQVLITFAAMGMFVFLVFWIDYHNVLSRMIG